MKKEKKKVKKKKKEKKEKKEEEEEEESLPVPKQVMLKGTRSSLRQTFQTTKEIHKH